MQVRRQRFENIIVTKLCLSKEIAFKEHMFYYNIKNIQNKEVFIGGHFEFI